MIFRSSGDPIEISTPAGVISELSPCWLCIPLLNDSWTCWREKPGEFMPKYSQCPEEWYRRERTNQYRDSHSLGLTTEGDDTYFFSPPPLGQPCGAYGPKACLGPSSAPTPPYLDTPGISPSCKHGNTQPDAMASSYPRRHKRSSLAPAFDLDDTRGKQGVHRTRRSDSLRAWIRRRRATRVEHRSYRAWGTPSNSQGIIAPALLHLNETKRDRQPLRVTTPDQTP